jgi:hypothetical protein
MMAVSQKVAAVAMLTAACLAQVARAKEEPLYEFGLGLGAIAFQDYRGSDTAHGYPLPFPYVSYNGKFLKANRDGIRGTLFNQDIFELNLSFDATTPVRSDRERNGMPDLKSTVEFGPSFDVHLMRSDDAKVKLDLRIRCTSDGRGLAQNHRLDLHAQARSRYQGSPGSQRLESRPADGPPLRRSPLQRLFLYGRSAICDGESPAVSRRQRLFRHPVHHRRVEAISQILGGRISSLRHPVGRNVRGQPPGAAQKLSGGWAGIFLDDHPVVAHGRSP